MSAAFLKSHYLKLKITVPSLHVVLGSGLGGVFSQSSEQKKDFSDWAEVGTLPFNELPGLPKTSVEGHPGLFRYFRNAKTGRVVCFQCGRLHGYEGHSPRTVVTPVMSARMAGTQVFILTNAAGGLKKNFSVGSIMLISDHVNLTGTSPLVGSNPKNEEGRDLGPRFPDMSAVYDKKIAQELKQALVRNDLVANEGVYLGLMGPTYETPAEVALFASWGLGAVGMSTVWEAHALKHSGATIGGLSIISNMACGLMGDEALNHADVEAIGKKVATKLVSALFEYCGTHA